MATMQQIVQPGLQAGTAAAGMAALKTKLRNTWMAGDYDQFSRYMEGEARSFYERLNVLGGMRLLDVGCGSGQLALIAARDGLRVTGVDIADNLIERARARAAAERLSAQFDTGDAEELPYGDGSFDVVTSLIGAMFAPRPERVAREMARVCVPGGMLAMANWTAEGFVGQMFGAISKYIAPSGMPSPLQWGNEETVRERFAGLAAELRMMRRHYTFSYPFGVGEVVEFFRRYYGPMNKAFAGLEEGAQEALRRELESLWSRHNLAGGGITVVEAEYLEVMARRR